MAQRRRFMQIAGGTGVVVAAAGGGLSTFALTRTPHAALAAWEEAGQGYDDPRLEAFSFGLLAPNPHNRQPWLLRLEGDNQAVLTADPARRLPQTDPFDRQIVIGLGCFLELSRLAAAAQGFDMRSHLFPEGEGGPRLDDRPVAALTFRPSPSGAGTDPLFDQVLARRTNKEPFDTNRTIAAAELDRLISHAGLETAAGGTVDAARIDYFRNLTWRAHLRESTTPSAFQESVDLMRIGKAEINANPDGIDLGGPFLEGLAVMGVLSREQLADPNSQAFAQGLAIYEEILTSGMGYVWLVTDANSRLDQIDAGRSWVRLNLQATAMGIGIHALSQALQEFPEMADLKTEMEDAVGISSNRRLQMFARIGYGPAVPPTPRWPLEARLRS